jgi:hypothetical protein
MNKISVYVTFTKNGIPTKGFKIVNPNAKN